MVKNTFRTLREDVEAFLKATGMNPTAFGLETMKDPSFVPKLRKGRSVREDTAAKVRAYMSRNGRRVA